MTRAATPYQVTYPVHSRSQVVIRTPTMTTRLLAEGSPAPIPLRRQSSAPPPTPVATPPEGVEAGASHGSPPRPCVRAPAGAPAATTTTTTPQHGAAGDCFRVNGRTLKCVRELGRGSFGVVWEVQEHEGGPLLALKISTPANQQLLEACLLEAEVLRQLEAALPSEVADAQRVPRYVTHARASQGGGSGTVQVAMSKLAGRPLDQWIYGIDESCFKTRPVAELCEGPLPGGNFASRDFAGACGFAGKLLSQLVPVFDALGSIAFHRDVSGHNFLIRDADGSEQLSILDFGLAVDARSWHREWQTSNIAGDPRYFTPAAWMMIAYGCGHVRLHPDQGFQRQYVQRLDHFGLGVAALEALFALWDGSTVADADADSGRAAARRRALGEARAAWLAYWKVALGLFQGFHAEGPERTSRRLSRSQDVPQLLRRLRALCSALANAAAVAPDPAEAAVLRVAAGLIDWRSSLSWRDAGAWLSAESRGARETTHDVRARSGAGTCPRGPEEAPEAAAASPSLSSRSTPSGGGHSGFGASPAASAAAPPPQRGSPATPPPPPPGVPGSAPPSPAPASPGASPGRITIKRYSFVAPPRAGGVVESSPGAAGRGTGSHCGAVPGGKANVVVQGRRIPGAMGGA